MNMLSLLENSQSSLKADIAMIVRNWEVCTYPDKKIRIKSFEYNFYIIWKCHEDFAYDNSTIKYSHHKNKLINDLGPDN